VGLAEKPRRRLEDGGEGEDDKGEDDEEALKPRQWWTFAKVSGGLDTQERDKLEAKLAP
jgi:hypothetical protein